MRTTVFVDIDGVLSFDRDILSGISHLYDSSSHSRIPLKFYPLDAAAVASFQSILEEFDVDVVLSSSWRFAPFLNYMEILTKNGMDPKLWANKQKDLRTTPINIKCRWSAIRAYVRTNPCRPVIIDDFEPPNGFIGNFLDNHDGFYIRTYEPSGLSDPEVRAQVRRILIHCKARTEGVY
jgi:hypothetical protein